MENLEQPDFLIMWTSYSEDILGDIDKLWVVVVRENDQIVGSVGLDVNEPDAMATSKSLNGIVFNDVISIDIGENDSITRIYLQKNVGLIGFEDQDSVWIVE